MNERCTECARIRKQREQTRKGVTIKSSMRHLMAKFSGGLLGEKPYKHKDREVHLKRFQTQTANMVTSRC